MNSTSEETGEESIDIRRDQLYSEREEHLVTLGRFFKKVMNDQVLNNYTHGELQILNERIRTHFEKFEQTHRAYKVMTLLASNEIYIC